MHEFYFTPIVHNKPLQNIQLNVEIPLLLFDCPSVGVPVSNACSGIWIEDALWQIWAVNIILVPLRLSPHPGDVSMTSVSVTSSITPVRRRAALSISFFRSRFDKRQIGKIAPCRFAIRLTTTSRQSSRQRAEKTGSPVVCVPVMKNS